MGLQDLGQAMTDCDKEELESNTLFAGYTYLGQFIDHDLTLDITPLAAAHPDEASIRNFHTPFLDLDHVYLGGPTVSPFLYELSDPPGEELFLIGMTADTTLNNEAFLATQNDLPRNYNGIALTGDPRQDENLIIAQLHVAFLKFHNCVMQELGKPMEQCKVSSLGPENATRFEQTRRIVTWCYQYVVFNDFLKEILNEGVFNELRGRRVLSSTRRLSFCLPIEFSAAAFRFGHSMVRNSYRAVGVANHPDVSLGCLIALTGSGGKNLRRESGPCGEDMPTPLPDSPFKLPADWKIKWEDFFKMPNGKFSPNRPRKIDTYIADGLQRLNDTVISQFNAFTLNDTVGHKNAAGSSPEPRLPVRTLLRGSRMGLPTGQDIARAFRVKNPLCADEIKKGPHEAVLTAYQFQRHTPLWYYILKEAELRGCSEEDGCGETLGEVGSRIVGEVILRALQADPNSYLSVNPGWQPELGGEKIFRMSGILDFIERCA